MSSRIHAGLRGGAVVGVIALAALLAGCGSDESPNESGPGPGGGPGGGGQAPQVIVDTPIQRDVTEYYHYTGTLAATAEVDIAARVPGYLTAIHFEPSTDVEAGELLFEIEHEPYEIAVASARARVAEAEALRTRHESTYNQTLAAYEQNAASKLEMIRARADYEQARAQVESAEQALAQAELDLSYTYVKSPISGRIGRWRVDQGNLVGEGEQTVLAKVVQVQPIWAYFDVSERIVLEYLKRGRVGTVDERADTIDLALANDPLDEYPYHGVLDFIDTEVDTATGTIRVRGKFDNEHLKLFPGLFARLRVPYNTVSDAVLVEEDAIQRGLGGDYLLVLDEQNIVSRRIVTPGPRQGGRRVIREGIGPDERYIVAGIQKARPGEAVKPKPREDTTTGRTESKTQSASDTDGST